MDLIDSLYLFLEEQEENAFIPQTDESMSDEEIEERFRIQNKEQANYYVRKYKEIEREEASIEETALAELERVKKNIEEWKERELKKLQYPKYFFAGLLENFAKEQLDGTNKRSLSLPNGSMSFKKQQDEYKYDDDALKAYILNHEHLKDYLHIEEVVKVDKKSLKKAITDSDGKAYLEGEEIPGISITHREMKFDIK